MRWIWIDRILELEKGKRCVALKNVTMAEDVLHDHFPAEGDRLAMPIFPQSLIVEGMAQTAGILVSQYNDYKEKVILAKISKARFTALAKPGMTLRYTADIERIDDMGASTSGTVERLEPTTGEATPLGEIELMFSHIDQNRAGLKFPEHNFVITDQFHELLSRSGFPADK